MVEVEVEVEVHTKVVCTRHVECRIQKRFVKYIVDFEGGNHLFVFIHCNTCVLCSDHYICTGGYLVRSTVTFALSACVRTSTVVPYNSAHLVSFPVGYLAKSRLSLLIDLRDVLETLPGTSNSRILCMK